MSAARIDVLQRLRDQADAFARSGDEATWRALDNSAKLLESELRRLDARETLRDSFAAAALTGLLAWPGDEAGGNQQTNNTPEGVADLSYLYADAMMARRLKP